MAAWSVVWYSTVPVEQCGAGELLTLEFLTPDPALPALARSHFGIQH